VKTSVINTSLGKIEYNLYGLGKPILFVHGGHIDCTETIFQKGLDPNNFCFITPSRPGYGNTPLSELNKTPKGTADLFIALLDEIKITKVILVGISAGGLTALEIAAHYPDRIESLILMSALTQKWFVETDKVYIWGKKLFAPRVERFTWLFYRLFFSLFPKIMTKAMFKQLSSYRPIEFTKDEFQELKQLTLKMRSRQGFVNDLDQSIDQGILTKIECPTLILNSNYDNQVDLSHALNATINVKNSRMVTYNNRWGHLIWLGEGYNQYLNEFKEQIR